MRNEERKEVWVDHFQTKLTSRIVVYLVLFLFVLFNFLFAWRLVEEGVNNCLEQYGRMMWDYLPVGICLLVLVPVMAWDTICFSHRLVGPLLRFRRAMTDVAQGEAVQSFKLREGDYLTDLRDDFNCMLESLQRRGLPVLKPRDPGQEDDSQRTSA